MTIPEIQRRILIRLSKGVTTLSELNQLEKIFLDKYINSGKEISTYIDHQSFSELHRRLKTSVFSEAGETYPIGFKKYCIYGEYHNTKLFIENTKKLLLNGQKYGDITNPLFYGQPDPGYKISYETLVHILLRHNETINSLINKDSVVNGYNPSSFGFGAIASQMLIMLMALNVLEEKDWQKATAGKSFICHFSVGGEFYTLVRKGSSKEILSFYPRNDDLKFNFIKLKRYSDKMKFVKE